MNKNKINLYISSKKYLKNNLFEVNIPTGLIRCDEKTEYIVLNINGFVMQNSFYNTQKTNNKYDIIVSNIDGTGVIIHNKELPIGNYNVNELLVILKTQLTGLLNVRYDANLNKYIFKNDILNNKNVIIKSITSNDFIGFENGFENILYTSAEMFSKNPINMSGDELICLSIPNIQKKYPVLSNFKNGNMIDSSIVAYLSINVPPFGLMEYKNQDGGDSFSYRLENTTIDSLIFESTNQDGETINVGPYQLNIQFEVHKKITSFEILKKIERLVSNIFQFIGKDIK